VTAPRTSHGDGTSPVSGGSAGSGGSGAVARSLGLVPGTKGYRYVEELGHVVPDDTRFPVQPLARAVVEERCDWLGLAPADTADVVETFPRPDLEPGWWWCTERAATRLLASIGDLRAPEGCWPSFEGPGHGTDRRCHLLHVAALVAPRTAAFLRRSGIPEPVVRASLGDLGRHAAIHRRMYGMTGLEAGWWGAVCLRGELVELGRLQFTRFLVDGDENDPEDRAARVAGYRNGEECLAVHIPEAGPLLPALVDDSLGAAARLPTAPKGEAGRPRIATCCSWLLDPQLAAYLPPEANIVRFQRRFHLVPEPEPGDADVFDFVFRTSAGRPDGEAGSAGGPDVDLDRLPQRTAMERAAVAHLRAGRHWERRTGWLELPG
jgi:GNAT-like C-terminal domain/N-acyltransferase N-terminal domain